VPVLYAPALPTCMYPLRRRLAPRDYAAMMTMRVANRAIAGSRTATTIDGAIPTIGGISRSAISRTSIVRSGRAGRVETTLQAHHRQTYDRRKDGGYFVSHCSSPRMTREAHRWCQCGALRMPYSWGFNWLIYTNRDISAPNPTQIARQLCHAEQIAASIPLRADKPKSAFGD
jgi:hypothetical protein